VAGGPRVAIGFSLGGFAAGLWAVRRPGAFDHVGLYDGTFPWPAFDDPRREGSAFSDRIFTEMGIFGPAFGPVGRRRAALRRWNPVDDLRRLDAGRLARLRRSTFWIASASRDGQAGNLDRTRRARDLLADRGVPLGFGADAPVSFHDHARHTYAWADRFAVAMLRRALG
jgi:pimeloyl-ACP methyl ester carboxylesterase